MAVHPVTPETPIPGLPSWIEPSLHVTAGRDPLGLQTITRDRIIPRLVPGILALSRRARYFSFYTFLLREYERQRLTATTAALSDYLKRREYEYGLAVQLCPRGCGDIPTGVVGKQRVGPAARGDGPFERGESVQSFLGGYGLYYQTPLVDLGIVVPRGTPYGPEKQPTPIDIVSGDERSERLAQAFLDAIAPTAYFQHHMRGVDPVPKDVLREYALRACLCRLPEFPDEQASLRTVLFEPSDRQPAADVQRRRRSFALFLDLLDTHPDVAVSDAGFRHAIWQSFEDDHAVAGAALAGWAALIAKEFVQEGLASVWSAACRLGLKTQVGEGVTPAELRTMARETMIPSQAVALPGGTLNVQTDDTTAQFAEAVGSRTATTSLEDVRRACVDSGTAVAGLILIFAVLGRLPDASRTHPAWMEIGSQDAGRQPGLLRFAGWVNAHLAGGPNLADTMEWIVDRMIVRPHEAIAYSKLPEYTFRFRWEGSRLRFTGIDPGRFGLTDIRRSAMSWITRDVGFWEDTDDKAQLTDVGRAFIREVRSS